MTKKLRVDLSEWDMGEEWIEASQIHVTQQYGKVIIEVGDPREDMLRKVLTEAMEALLNESFDTLIDLTKEGITIRASELNEAITIPWNKTLIHYSALAALKAECDNQAELGSEEAKHG